MLFYFHRARISQEAAERNEDAWVSSLDRFQMSTNKTVMSESVGGLKMRAANTFWTFLNVTLTLYLGVCICWHSNMCPESLLAAVSDGWCQYKYNCCGFDLSVRHSVELPGALCCCGHVWGSVLHLGSFGVIWFFWCLRRLGDDVAMCSTEITWMWLLLLAVFLFLLNVTWM